MSNKRKFLVFGIIVMMIAVSLFGCGKAEEVVEEETIVEVEETETVAEEEIQEEEVEAEVEEEPAVDTLANKDAALEYAKKHLDIMPASYIGLIEYMVEFEGYTQDEATYAADNCGADWNEQAVRHIEYYMNVDDSYTRDRMLGQLEYEGYTTEQAEYAVDAAGLE